VSFTTNIRFNFGRRRLTPYGVLGGGVVSETVAYTVTRTSIDPVSVLIAPRTIESHVFLGLTGGGGVSVLVGQRVSIDGDFRGLYMRGANFQWVRVGVGASYRF
jgi:opacity protein-like surface antigen